MACRDNDEGFFVWLSEPRFEDLLAGMSLEAVVRLVEENAPEPFEGESCGFIVKDWFGPFLLSPETHFLRGRC